MAVFRGDLSAQATVVITHGTLDVIVIIPEFRVDDYRLLIITRLLCVLGKMSRTLPCPRRLRARVPPMLYPFRSCARPV